MSEIARKINLYMFLVGLLKRIEVTKRTDPGGMYFGQLPIIEYIASHDGCTQKELASALLVSPASIAVSAKRLQKAGLVEKKPDARNARCNSLSVTELGLIHAERCRAVFDAVDEEMFLGFSQQELECLGEYVKRMADNLGGESLSADSYSFFTAKHALEERERKRDNKG